MEKGVGDDGKVTVDGKVGTQTGQRKRDPALSSYKFLRDKIADLLLGGHSEVKRETIM